MLVIQVSSGSHVQQAAEHSIDHILSFSSHPNKEDNVLVKAYNNEFGLVSQW